MKNLFVLIITVILQGCCTCGDKKAEAPITKTSFVNNEIVFPKGKPEIEKFLELLKDPGNKKTVGLPDGTISYKEIPQEGSAVFGVDSDSYMLYHDDLNNDGKPEYFVIYLNSGSGNYSGVKGTFVLDGGKLKSLHFDDDVVNSQFPGHDMSRFHMFLARPFAVHFNGKTYLRFQDEMMAKRIYMYLWQDGKFKLVN